MRTKRRAAGLLAVAVAASATAVLAVPSDSAALAGPQVGRARVHRAPAPAPAWGALVQATAARLEGAGSRWPTSAHSPTPPGDPAQIHRDQIGGPLLASRGILVREPGRGGRPVPRVPASAYLIADAGSGQVLAAKDAHGLFPPASTLKVLTAITMLPLLRPGATVVASKRAATTVPNVVGLVAGHRYRIADLFRALLLISANDAAVALVEASGSFTHGMALINAEARHLQAYDVVAKYPNGLPAPGQVVSAYDLALIARAALAMPAFMRYDSARTARFPVSNRKRVLLVNQNYLLTDYRGGLGGKIGWTSKAGATYIGLARRHGVTLIVTILHARPLTEIDSAEKLLTWGFAMDSRVSPVGELVPPLAKARAASRPSFSRTLRSPPGSARTLAGASGGSKGPVVLAASIAGGLCVILLAGLAWLRRRASAGKPRVGGPAS